MQFSFTQCVVGGFLLSCAVGTATWNFRNDRVETLELTVSSYEKAKEWRLPEAIINIEKASAHLDSKLSSILENKRLQEQVLNLKEKLKEKNDENLHIVKEKESEVQRITKEKDAIITKLDKNLVLVQKDLKKANDFINSLYTKAEEFTLKKGESKKLLGMDVVMSVIDINPYGNWASVVIENRRYSMYVGNVSTITHGSDYCQISLNRITGDVSVDFTFTCKNYN